MKSPAKVVLLLHEFLKVRNNHVTPKRGVMVDFIGLSAADSFNSHGLDTFSWSTPAPFPWERQSNFRCDEGLPLF